MKNLRKWESTLCAFLFVLLTRAQQIGFTGDEAGSLYRDQLNGGAYVHTNGWGVGAWWGRWISYDKAYDVEFSFTILKHPKEIKRKNVYQIENAPSFVYGKLYYVNVWSLGFVRTRVLNEKPYWGGIDVRWWYGAGGDLFWLIPTYLQIIHTSSQTAYYYISVERYDPEHHTLEDIYGRASYFKGMSKSSVFPGAYLKAGFSFDFAAKRKRNSLLETGILIHAALAPIQIMAFHKAQMFFINAYAGLYLGRKFLYQRYAEEHS